MKDLIGNTLLNDTEVQARTHDDEGTTSNEVPYDRHFDNEWKVKFSDFKFYIMTSLILFSIMITWLLTSDNRC